MLLSVARVQATRGDLSGALALLLAYGEHEQLEGASNPASTPWRSRAARISAALGQRQQARELATQELEAAYRWGTPRVIGAGLGCLGDALELAESRGARLAGRVRAELVAAGVRLVP